MKILNFEKFMENTIKFYLNDLIDVLLFLL